MSTHVVAPMSHISDDRFAVMQGSARCGLPFPSAVVQQRTARSLDDREDGGALQTLLEAVVANPQSRGARPSTADRGRATTDLGGVERHQGRLPAGQVHPPAVRRTVAAHPYSEGSGFQRPATELCAARCQGQSAGTPRQRAGRQARHAGGDLRGVQPGDGHRPRESCWPAFSASV